MAKKRKKLPLQSSSSLGSSLADALQLKGFAASPTPETTPSGTPRQAPTPVTGQLSSLKKLVLRRERKGRGGKTVTIVSGFTDANTDLKPLARELGKALGCGTSVESDTLVIQGDQVERAATWFNNQGVAKVVRGS
jgi:translation initiation factor 1